MSEISGNYEASVCEIYSEVSDAADCDLGMSLEFNGAQFTIVYGSGFQNVDLALNKINEESDPNDRIFLYYILATLNPERAEEILHKAENDLINIPYIGDRIEAAFMIADGYLMVENANGLEEIISVIEELCRKEMNPAIRLWCFLDLALLFEKRSAEFIQKAKNELGRIPDVGFRIDLAFDIAYFYLLCEDTEGLREILKDIEKLNLLMYREDEKLMNLVSITAFRAEISLIERNKAEFDLLLAEMKAIPLNLLDWDTIQWVKEEIEYFEAKRAEVFSADLLPLLGRRV